MLASTARILAQLACCLGVTAGALGQPTQPAPTASPDRYTRPALFTVHTSDESWHDAPRNRDVPVRIYTPQAGSSAVAARYPIVVFSHGLGGSGKNYSYFGEHLASHGFLVIAPTHAGSDTAALLDWLKNHPDEKPERGKGWLASSISDPDNLRNRPRDISFVIDQVAERPSTSAIADTSLIAVAGHSFGAYTAMAIGGMLVDLPDAPDTSFRDARVKAILPMSPEGKGTMGIDEHSWDHFAAPVLFLTGTKDYGAGGRAAAWRREPFDSIHGPDTYLATIEGATHMTFSGRGAEEDDGKGDDVRGRFRRGFEARIRDRIDVRGLSEPDPDESAHLELVRALSLAFIDGYLKDDPDARAWLKGYFAAPHADCQAEFKAAESK